MSDLKADTMKKIGLIVVFAFLAAIALSSCNRQVCPAYASNDKDNTEQAG